MVYTDIAHPEPVEYHGKRYRENIQVKPKVLTPGAVTVGFFVTGIRNIHV